MNVLPKLFSAHDGRQRCRESLKLDKCSLEDDPEIRKLSRNLLELLESEGSRVTRSPNVLAMVYPEL
jgi:hypothetical protein